MLYIALMAVLTVLYRLIVQGWMEGILPQVLAAGLAWVLAAAVVVLAAVGVRQCPARPNRAHALRIRRQRTNSTRRVPQSAVTKPADVLFHHTCSRT